MPLLMPLNSRVHFKTAFAFVANDGQDPMIVLRKNVYSWVKKHPATGKDERYQLFPTWFMKGDADQHVINKSYIRTASNYGKYSKDSPEHWVMEFIHEDSEFSQRLWSVNVGLARLSEQKVRFSCVVKYGIRENYIGEIPIVPIPTVPRFIKNILKTKLGICCRENTFINTDYSIITKYEVDEFIEKLNDKKRYLPFIVISLDDDNQTLVSPQVLQSQLLGNANVFLLDNEALFRFNEVMPYELRCHKNMVRIFFYFRENDDGVRHRFYLLDRYEGSYDSVENQIVTALSRNAHNFRLSELCDINQVIFLRNKHRIEQLKKNIDENDYEGLANLYMKEVDDLQARLLESEKVIQMYEEENQILSEKERMNTWKLSDYKRKLNEIRQLRNQVNVVLRRFSLPEDLCSCLELAGKLYSDRIEIHENALKSAKSFEQKNVTNLVYECWNIISSIAFEMYALKFDECNINIRDEFVRRTGISFSMTESSTSKKDSSIVKTRIIEYNGKQVEFYPHFRSKVNGHFRIHIAFLDDEKKILICHCGEHLTNAMTRHLK